MNDESGDNELICVKETDLQKAEEVNHKVDSIDAYRSV